jgi:hypothetical protein
MTRFEGFVGGRHADILPDPQSDGWRVWFGTDYPTWQRKSVGRLTQREADRLGRAWRNDGVLPEEAE